VTIETYCHGRHTIRVCRQLDVSSSSPDTAEGADERLYTKVIIDPDDSDHHHN